MRKIYISLLISLLASGIFAQQYRNPVDFQMLLSGNFGELRNNHFHAGIDIKTQSVINKPVHSIEDGYVSRIFKAPAGYGLALYITHPKTGHTSVYGHLQEFAPKIAAYVKQKQYEQESFRINLICEPELFPVKRGELIAYSGNTGSSGGPHIHFEIRNTETEFLLDPIEYYKNLLTDKVAPKVRGIAVYPILSEGIVNGTSKPFRQNISKTKNGSYQSVSANLTAWGKIGLGVKAYDKMSGTHNIYGVKHIRLYQDGTLIFTSSINTFGFDHSRMLNSFVDFEDWRLNRSFFMKSFVDPGNTLPFYDSDKKGYITIDQQKTYNFRYELEDAFGNVEHYAFSVEGRKQAIPQQVTGLSQYMVWNQDNHYLSDNFSLIIPKGNLYADFPFTLKQSSSDVYFSDRYQVNDRPVPFHDKAEVKIKLKSDPLKDKKQYGIVLLKGGKEQWVGGYYSNQTLIASIREAGGEYAISYDDKAPVITPVQSNLWERQQKIVFKAADNKSGISSWRGTIDGQFALFEHDVKSPTYTYKFDSSRLTRNKTHKLEFTVTDACGNASTYSSEFYY